MARGRGLTPDEARILSRFKRLGPQRRALTLALSPFRDDQGRFDRELWTEAFTSEDPEDIVRVFGVTGGFQGIVNHFVEMLRAGARLAGLDVARAEEKPAAPALIAAVRDDGGLTANQAEVLGRLHRARNNLQHESFDVQADHLFDDLELLQKTLPRLATSYIEWMKHHDVRLLPAKK
jgi:hypothetical protein